jgi:methionine-rich copper-binding protein CopC
MNSSSPFVRRVAFLGLVVAVVFALPARVAAHSELETADPPDGAVLSAPPAEVVLTFSAELNTSKSSVTLHDSAGTQIAKGGVDSADDTVMRLVPPASLAPGTYEIRWTSVALDGDLLRGTLQFDLTAPTPSPTPSPTATPSAAPSATASPTPAPSSSPSPSPSAAPGSTSGSGSDVILPIIVALIVIVLLGMLLLRGRSRGGGGA